MATLPLGDSAVDPVSYFDVPVKGSMSDAEYFHEQTAFKLRIRETLGHGRMVVVRGWEAQRKFDFTPTAISQFLSLGSNVIWQGKP